MLKVGRLNGDSVNCSCSSHVSLKEGRRDGRVQLQIRDLDTTCQRKGLGYLLEVQTGKGYNVLDTYGQ